MTRRVKLHVGCGTVFLCDGWVNVDVAGPHVHLASARPDLAGKWGTTEADYYGRHRDKTVATLAAGPLIQESVCDVYGDFTRLPCGLGEAEEILARQVFEHLSIAEARAALDECDRALAPGGVLRLSVPDVEETLKRYKLTGDDLMWRHFLGPRSSERGYHLVGYTLDYLRSLVEEHGFDFVGEESNPHLYPSICVKFVKPGKPLPRDYALAGIEIKPGWRCLEIGPGEWPWSRADVWVDHDPAWLEKIDAPAERKVIADLDSPEPLPFADKSFDFVYCSHVLEHVKDPVRVAAEISRIAKRGLVVTPHAFKDALFLWEEGTHIWWVFPPQREGGPIGFMPVDYARRNLLADPNASGALCRALRTGPNRLEADSRTLRRWFRRAEPALDVITEWQDNLRVEVLRW